MSSQGRMVEINYDGSTAQAYLVGDAEGERGPALIVIHEWWGLTGHIKDIADRFAAQGYVVLAPDLFGGVTTKNAEEASSLMQGLDHDHALRILDAAVNFLKGDTRVDPSRIGVTGFCMGGTFALLLACHNSDIRAAAPFYGDVPDEETLQGLTAPVLFIAGENDPWINQEKTGRLDAGLKNLGKEGEVKVYAGAGHAFFNDTRPEAYDPEAARDAWGQVTEFFKQHLSR